MAEESKRLTVDQRAAKINKRFGDGTIIRGDQIRNQETERCTTGSLAFDVMLGGGWPLNKWNEIIGNECLVPGTKILCTDLTWRNIEDLVLGDEVIGFDESPGGRGKGSTSRYRRATVDDLGRKMLPCYEIRTQYGTTRASAGHLWLVHFGGKRQWVRTDQLKTHHKIASIGQVWETNTSWEAGWLAGFYDGEGSLSAGGGENGNGRVTVAQVKGQTSEYLETMLDKTGFSFNRTHCKAAKKNWQDKWSYRLAGRYEDMRFIGSIRPQRLAPKASRLWEGVSTKQVHGCAATVLSVTPIGDREVVTIGTSTKTLIADGLLSHNSAGKTVMVSKTIAANMALDPEYKCLWVASEDYVPDWEEIKGVDLSRVILANTNVTEEAYQIIIDYLEDQSVDAVVLDSLPNLTPSEEVEKTMEQYTVGLNALLTNKFMRKSTKAGKRSLTEEERPCLGLIINQWRDKIGTMWGDPRTTPGGKGKDFTYFTRVEVARDDWIEHEKQRVGLVIKARTRKNKTFPVHRTGQMDFYFADHNGIPAGDYDILKDTFNMAKARDIIIRRGSMYDFGQEVLGKGEDAACMRLRSEPDLYREVQEAVLKVM